MSIETKNFEIQNNVANLKKISNVFIFLMILLFFYFNISNVPFHSDEADWIASSSTFEDLTTGDFSSITWRESYWTLTQPPLPRYIIGLGRYSGGIDKSELNNFWDWDKDLQFNMRSGNMPSSRLLWWSRLPMTILTSLSVFIGFLAIKHSSGILSSLIWILLVFVNSYYRYILCRATGDAALLAGIMLMLFFSHKALVSAESTNRNLIKLILFYFPILGVIIGLATSSKLNGLMTIIAGIILSLIISIRTFDKTSKKMIFLMISIGILLIISTVTWIVLNPFLYPDPIVRTRNMFSHRVMEIQYQQKFNPEAKIEGFNQLLKIVPRRIYQDYSSISIRGFLIINFLFSLIGIMYIFIQSILFLFNKSRNSYPIIILLVSITSASPSLLAPLDWSRYYLLPVFFSTMFISIGFIKTLEFVIANIRNYYVSNVVKIN